MKSVKYENKIIAYTVNKAKVKNLYISIENGEVAIKAPWYVTSSQIQEIVEQKREWIYEKLSEYNNSPRATKKYKEGERFQILSQNYYLQIQFKNIQQAKLNVEKGIIDIILPNKLKNKNNKEKIKSMIEKMYQMIAEKEIEDAMEKVRIRVGLAPEEYKVKKLTRVWGNCSSTKKITLNRDLVMYSRKAIEYVVLHEICHLKYMNHSKKFWNMVEEYMPDYKEAEIELKK